MATAQPTQRVKLMKLMTGVHALKSCLTNANICLDRPVKVAVTAAASGDCLLSCVTQSGQFTLGSCVAKISYKSESVESFVLQHLEKVVTLVKLQYNSEY